VLSDRQYLSELLSCGEVDGWAERWNESTVALGIKDPETERLAAEVAELSGETKTAAVRGALRERLERLQRGRELRKSRD
jgi:Rv0623-like transcription factor